MPPHVRLLPGWSIKIKVVRYTSNVPIIALGDHLLWLLVAAIHACLHILLWFLWLTCAYSIDQFIQSFLESFTNCIRTGEDGFNLINFDKNPQAPWVIFFISLVQIKTEEGDKTKPITQSNENWKAKACYVVLCLSVFTLKKHLEKYDEKCVSIHDG